MRKKMTNHKVYCFKIKQFVNFVYLKLKLALYQVPVFKYLSNIATTLMNS